MAEMNLYAHQQKALERYKDESVIPFLFDVNARIKIKRGI